MRRKSLSSLELDELVPCLHVAADAPLHEQRIVIGGQTCRTADGWVFVMAQLPKFWTLLVDRIGRADLATDPRFASVPLRLENRDALTQELDRTFMTQSTAHWIELLGGTVPVAPVYDLAQALDSPWQQAMGMIDVVDHPARAGMRILANPIRIDGARLPNRVGPSLGADTKTLLDEIGVDAARIKELRAKKVI